MYRMNKKRGQEKIIGIYHKDCLDGTTAAAVLFKKFSHNIILFPLERSYSTKDLRHIFALIDKTTTVYIVDFALRDDKEMRKFAKSAKRIIIIDHHISDKDRLEHLGTMIKNFELVFSLNHSGASLSWIYFFGKKNIPKIVTLVEDGDLGRWKFKEKTTQLGGYLIPLLNQPQKVAANFDTPIKTLLQQGKIVSDFIDYLLDLYVKRAGHIVLKIGPHKTIAYNVTFNSERMRTLLGFILTKKHNATVAMFSIKGKEVHLSFRGIDNVNPSAGDLAKILGGGGHRNAAGAAVWLKDFCKMIIKK